MVHINQITSQVLGSIDIQRSSDDERGWKFKDQQTQKLKKKTLSTQTKPELVNFRIQAESDDES